MNKAKVSFLAGMLAVTVMVSGCAKGGFSPKVATVNGTVITKAEYDKTFGEMQKNMGLDSAGADPEQKKLLDDYLKQMTLNKLIMQTLIDNDAAKSGISVTDADVKAYKEEKIFKDPAIKAQFQTFLTTNKMSESDFDAMVKETLLLNKFMDVKGGDAVKVSDSEVKNFYDKNVDQFKMPESIHAQHILVKAIVPQLKQELRKTQPNITDAELEKNISAKKQELKAKAEKLFSEVKAKPAEFEKIAKENSEDTMSAVKGGDLGYMPAGTVDPSFWQAADKTPKGQLYPGVVSSQFGYHIIKVLDHKAPHQQTFEEAKADIREHMAQQKKQVFMQQWVQGQRAVAKIQVEPAYEPKKEPAAAAQQGGAMAPKAGEQPAPQPVATEGKH